MNIKKAASDFRSDAAFGDYVDNFSVFRFFSLTIF